MCYDKILFISRTLKFSKSISNYLPLYTEINVLPQYPYSPPTGSTKFIGYTNLIEETYQLFDPLVVKILLKCRNNLFNFKVNFIVSPFTGTQVIQMYSKIIIPWTGYSKVLYCEYQSETFISNFRVAYLQIQLYCTGILVTYIGW